MPARQRRKTRKTIPIRTAAKAGLSAALILLGCENAQNAIANGDTRTISFHHLHTGEDLAITYKKNGRYDDDALKKINTIMRDWRRNQEVAMDPRLIDLVWEVRRDVGAGDTTVQIVCGYRAPGTNEMLRKRSRHSGVARFSQHTLGKAMDFYIPGAPLDELRAAGLRLQRGGVGFYPTSGSPFVHLDVGSIRHWPRMTHDQLAKVFPDGRTVHIPSDGRPLAGYDLALADIQRRGGEVSVASVQPEAATPRRNILAKLFGFGKDRDEDEDREAAPQQVAAAAPVKVVPTPIRRPAPPATESQKPMAASLIPLPKTRIAPPAPVQVAAVEPKGAPQRPDLPQHIYSVANAPRPPADVPAAAPETTRSTENIFDARGFWRGTPLESDKVELASADSSTGSIGPWAAPPERATPQPGEAAIGYAIPADPKIVKQQPMIGTLLSRPAGAETIAAKGVMPAPAEPIQVAAATPRLPQATALRIDDPWLRAVVMTPSVWSALTATVIGPLDMRMLAPFMQRPNDAVVMVFSDDPHNGMRADRFGGDAVVFVSTTTFTGRTASLR